MSDLSEPQKELLALVRSWQDRHDYKNSEVMDALLGIARHILRGFSLWTKTTGPDNQ